MTIPFTCPHCGASTNVDEQFAGTSGPCAVCGKMITVPPAAGSQIPTVAAEDPFAAELPRKSSKFLWIVLVTVSLLGLCCLISVPVGLILPALQAAREAARRNQCENNLHQIGVALQSYHDTQGCYPPPYFSDENGTPTHSWRVLILPQLGYTDLFDRYDFDEPWNGPNNRQLEVEMPPVFRCPSADPATGPFDTSYVAIVGPGLIFDPSKVVTQSEATLGDGMGSTIAVVESSGTSGASISWMSPDDPTRSALNPAINGVPGPAIGSDHPEGANVLFADGHVEFLSDSIDPKVLQDFMTVQGDASTEPEAQPTEESPPGT